MKILTIYLSLYSYEVNLRIIHTEIVNITWREGNLDILHLLCLQRCESLGVCVPLGGDCFGCVWLFTFWHRRAWWVLTGEEAAKSLARKASIFIIYIFHSMSTVGSKVWTARYYQERCKWIFIMLSKACFENYILKIYNS